MQWRAGLVYWIGNWTRTEDALIGWSAPKIHTVSVWGIGIRGETDAYNHPRRNSVQTMKHRHVDCVREIPQYHPHVT